MSDEMVGREFGHYKILARVGGGAMGVVYTADDRRLERVVALKFLPAAWCCDPLTTERFMREARAASALDHPNICTIHSIEGGTDQQVFIVMPFYEGETIAESVARGPLPLDEIINVTTQVLRGLAAAHEQGIVHRDIKPANLGRTKHGVVKILDFGLAKLTGAAVVPEAASFGTLPPEPGTDEITLTDAVMGTPAYMSPEQLTRRKVDHSSDIWSVGVVLYEMITGVRPFRGDSAREVARAILAAAPEPIASRREGLPEELERIVFRAMSKHRSDRFQRADDMLLDLRRVRDELKTGSRPSIAVLPFRNLSGDEEQEYFCDGMTEEIINALTQVEELRVVARSSAFAFKGRENDVREIARRLKAGTVVEGSVRRSGRMLRISAQLINVADGYQLWSAAYDRELEDVFAVQDEIACAIVEAADVRLREKRSGPLVRQATPDMGAYTAYLKGRFHWNKRTEPELRRGIAELERAIELDPEFALAHAGLADSYNVLGFYGALEPGESFPRAKAAARRALEIRESLAEAHTSLAFATMLHDWDWRRAERRFRRALALGPGYATAHHWYAEFLAARGRMDEAAEVGEAALRSDPLSLPVNTLVGWVRYYARDYGGAVKQLEETLALDAGFFPAHYWLAHANARLGRLDEAVALARKAVELSAGSPVMDSALGCALAFAGSESEARKVLEGLVWKAARAYVPAYHVATVHAALGQYEDALAWLERAHGRREPWLAFLGIEPVWDSLRSDEQFKSLSRRVGLPERGP